MIPRVHTRGPYATQALTEALGRPVSDQEGLTGHTVVAHWPGLAPVAPDDEQQIWTPQDWADHLDTPSWEYPRATSPRKDRFAIWHADVRLALGDRQLTGPEWSEIAHRLALAVGIATPGDTRSCRWIAVQAQPRRLDLIANLIRPDGTWTSQSGLLLRLATECRRLETALSLLGPLPARSSPHAAALPAAVHSAAETTGQLADEATGPLVTGRGLVEYAAHCLGALPHAYGPAMEHQLGWIARRLYGIQQDLDAVVADLAATPDRTAPPPALHVPRPPTASARTRSTPQKVSAPWPWPTVC